MKLHLKYTLSFLLLFFFFPTIFANNAEILSKNFRSECYEFYGKIGAGIMNETESYKIVSDKRIDVITQDGKSLPFREYNEKPLLTNNYYENFTFLNDNNKKTFIEVDTRDAGEFLVELEKGTELGTFDFTMDIDSKFHSSELYISNDGENFDKVSAYNVEDFSFQYFKIKFQSKNDIQEKIKIRELSFKDRTRSYLVQSIGNSHIELFGDYLCNGQAVSHSRNAEFAIDVNTKNLKVTLIKNPKLNVFKGVDTDNDWVDDSRDNCVGIYNPKQADIDGDSIGNACSDDDSDNILGHYDNCPNTYNPNQEDINRNTVGDVCEFDKDGDTIPDEIDNCINDDNLDQKDTDNDNIGDICDNCISFNPNQLDANNNSVGDVCEQIEENLRKNDKDNDKILDSIDNCPEKSNTDQADRDKDGVGDACDNCKELQNPKQLDLGKNDVGDMCEDADNDGFDGYRDNCMQLSNSDQEDSDNDGIGNVCEDDDGDELSIGEDNCPHVYNPKQTDYDKDGIGEACDEKDDRVLESNKSVFMVVLVIATLIFLGMIYSLVQKLNKK